MARLASLHLDGRRDSLPFDLSPAIATALREEALLRARENIDYLARALAPSEHINRNDESDVRRARRLVNDLELIVGLRDAARGAGR